MTHWIRVVDGVVTDCWDTPPPEGQEGWREAIENRPAKTKPHWEQGYGAHYFDLSKDPAEIVWPLEDFSTENAAQYKADYLRQQNQNVQKQLDAIDAKKVRAITDSILTGDNTRLQALEDKAVITRNKVLTEPVWE